VALPDQAGKGSQAQMQFGFERGLKETGLRLSPSMSFARIISLRENYEAPKGGYEPLTSHSSRRKRKKKKIKGRNEEREKPKTLTDLDATED